MLRDIDINTAGSYQLIEPGRAGHEFDVWLAAHEDWFDDPHTDGRVLSFERPYKRQYNYNFTTNYGIPSSTLNIEYVQEQDLLSWMQSNDSTVSSIVSVYCNTATMRDIVKEDLCTAYGNDWNNLTELLTIGSNTYEIAGYYHDIGTNEIQYRMHDTANDDEVLRSCPDNPYINKQCCVTYESTAYPGDTRIVLYTYDDPSELDPDLINQRQEDAHALMDIKSSGTIQWPIDDYDMKKMLNKPR